MKCLGPFLLLVELCFLVDSLFISVYLFPQTKQDVIFKSQKSDALGADCCVIFYYLPDTLEYLYVLSDIQERRANKNAALGRGTEVTQ